MSRLTAALFVGLTIPLVAGCKDTRTVTPGVPAPAPAAFSPDEQRAVDAAQGFLAKQGKDWGAPSKVTRAEGGYFPAVEKAGVVYHVTYPTAADEVKLIGDRVVLVDLKGDRAAFLPRR